MAYTSAFAIAFNNGAPTDATFRAWGVLFNAKFAAAGLVQVTGVGEINWVTVSAPVIANTAAGYEIWRFNDALQSTAPVFLKIEYGSAAATTGASVWITLGSGQDGAGNLTGIQSTRQQASTTTGGSRTAYFSGDTNRFAFAIPGPAAANQAWFLSVERTVDTAGAVTSEAVLMISTTTSGGVWRQVAWNCTLGPMTASWETSIGALTPSLAPFGTSGSQIAVFPVFHTKGVFYPPGLNALAYFDATIGALSPITFSFYGASHTYMPLGAGATINFTAFNRAGTSTVTPMMRWE